MTKVLDIGKAFEIDEYVVWTLKVSHILLIKTADVYIVARGNSDDYSSFDSIIADINGNKTKDINERIIAYYARKGRLKTVCLYCEIVICNKNLSNTDKNEFK